jgi:hypothetical protein
MTAFDFVKPWRLIAEMPLVLYGSLLLIELPQSWLWALLACGVTIAAVMLASCLEYPLLPLWPAFAGVFLLSTCICALVQDVVDYAIVPFTDSDIEIIAVAVVGIGFIGWGIQSARKMLAYWTVSA